MTEQRYIRKRRRFTRLTNACQSLALEANCLYQLGEASAAANVMESYFERKDELVELLHRNPWLTDHSLVE